MVNKIVKRIEELSQEAQQLVKDRGEALNNIHQIENRLTQIVATITELDRLVKENEPISFPLTGLEPPASC